VKHNLAPCALVIALSTGPASAADGTSATIAGGPLTPQQIVEEFARLPLQTQKRLVQILMSEDSQSERSATTQQLDSIFSTLPPDVQRNLYAKWDALSDEQRIALKRMDPDLIKSLVGPFFLTEATYGVTQGAAPVLRVLDKGRVLAEESRAYVQGLLSRNP